VTDVNGDRALVAAVGDVIARPKVAPADSFVLHAPLELLARAGLLRFVDPPSRDKARARLQWLADTYEAAGEPLDEPSSLPEQSVDDAADRLVDALTAGDLDEVDRVAKYLGEHASPSELRRMLAQPVVASLAAAAHASILLWLMPRIDDASQVTGAILREPARELGRHPDWRIRWFEQPGEPTSDELVDALLDVPMIGVPGSSFIYPIMNQAEESGIAPKLLAGFAAGSIDVARVRRELSRVAAWSMLQEPRDHAPYGWSHCLTMPQAVMGIAGDGADPRTAAAVAATHVVGFRAALGQRVLVPDYQPDPPSSSNLSEAIALGREVAAAYAWHAPESTHDAIVTTLATNASSHHDAHLVKYTLACFDAADADPSERRLYLAAAAYLAGWWAQQPTDGFFD
jgi:hypothetical protein